MIYGELGLLPLNREIKKRMITYWEKLITGHDSKLSSILYTLLLNDSFHRNISCKWLQYVENLLNKIGFNIVWVSQGTISKYQISEIHQRIDDIELQEIKALCNKSNKGKNYLVLKEGWERESYIHLLDERDVINMLKFRTSNHKLPVETGRYQRIEYKDRICKECHTDIGDEFHYLFKCPRFSSERKQYLLKKQIMHSNMIVFKKIFSQKDTTVLRNLSKFTFIIMNNIKT